MNTFRTHIKVIADCVDFQGRPDLYLDNLEIQIDDEYLTLSTDTGPDLHRIKLTDLFGGINETG